MLVCVIRRTTLGMLLLAAAGLLTAPAVLAQSQKQEIDLLKKQLEELRQRDEKTKQQLEELQRRLDGLQSQPPAQEKAPADKLEEAVQELPKAPTQPTTFAPALVSQRLGGVTFRLIDLSLDVLAGAGGSTVGDAELQRLEGGTTIHARTALPCRTWSSLSPGRSTPTLLAKLTLSFLWIPLTVTPSSRWKKPSSPPRGCPLGYK